MTPAETYITAGAEEPGPPLTFRRLASSPTTICGVLESGPIQCWGARSALYPGGFVDVAVAGGSVCGVKLDGTLDCFDAKLLAHLSKVKRISAHLDTYCVLLTDGTVSCFRETGETTLVPPEGLSARYISLGAGFACAAGETKQLSCWGDLAALTLPQDPIAVEDIAAGSGYVCALSSSGTPLCFGSAPPLGQESLNSITARGGTVCAQVSSSES